MNRRGAWPAGIAAAVQKPLGRPGMVAAVVDRHRRGRSWKRLREVAESIKREVEVYRRVLNHPRTPLASKVLLGAALGYALMPFDLIPDFLPVAGHLDDAIVVPVLVLLALWFLPKNVLAESRASMAAGGTA
jgi:uncharacterized membrane protein YkvA (DUF1232 family)